MGCTSSREPISPASDGEKATEIEHTVEWKLLPSSVEARKKFEADGTLSKNSDPGHLELRTMLDDPVAQPAIFKYAKQVVMAQDIFMCWVDIQEFKSIPTESYRRSKALHIYHKYIKPDAILVVGDIELSERERYKQELALSKDDPSILTLHFYDKIQTRCFLGMYHNVYLPFKSTNEYFELTRQLQKRYNHVKLNDFEYFGKLGEGGFGFVVHCRKRSTGKHYAMKLQTKKGLIECFSDDPWRADFEKQAFASCQHPFIVNLDYAFQTDSLAIMVLGLATAGDLQKALNRAAEERLSEERVRFYVAEIVLALSYLHQMGLMYRDLKPNNVLLNEDGHIQLVDLGGVADEYGVTLGQNDGNNLIPLFAQHFQRTKLTTITEDTKESSPVVVVQSTNSKKPKRKLSIMGTFGYMAPEMVIMLSQASHEKTGYTYSVDWWSLGVTMFKLLSGYRPFTDDNFNTFVEMATTMNALVREHCDSPEYAILFQEIPFPSHISPEAKDLISKLLDVNPKSRLGSGSNGSKNIKSHNFFKGIDWDLLEQKHIEPPYKPEHSRLLDELIPYPDFETLMKEYGKADWLNDAPQKEGQKYFANWYVFCFCFFFSVFSNFV
jgi:protein-serine/threonine kinase